MVKNIGGEHSNPNLKDVWDPKSSVGKVAYGAAGKAEMAGRKVAQLGKDALSKLSSIVATLHKLIQNIPKYGTAAKQVASLEKKLVDIENRIYTHLGSKKDRQGNLAVNRDGLSNRDALRLDKDLCDEVLGVMNEIQKLTPKTLGSVTKQLEECNGKIKGMKEFLERVQEKSKFDEETAGFANIEMEPTRNPKESHEVRHEKREKKMEARHNKLMQQKGVEESWKTEVDE